MARVIMIQGTMSNAGKTFLCAGLCRVFKQDGYRTAPFKSQNMALNSYITEEGLEMGRAQVMQAEAAGTDPDVRMNPILLKPTTDMGSQVIVMGEVLGNMQAKDYFAYKKQLLPVIQEAYESLAEEYDIIVIEGAGSPAEINLKQDDIVNMGMARMAKAPVLLVGDINRGGVFAQLYGTIALLEPEEVSMIKGMVINKFRGDKAILDPGLEMLEEKCGIPVQGVIPYLPVDIDDEDSLSERLRSQTAGERGMLQIVVIRLPRISNFTDFLALESTEGVEVRYAEKVSQVGTPDLLILPGSKSTMEDLRFIRQNGLEAHCLHLVHQGVPLMGICGGFQMLGRVIEDAQAVESGGSLPGMQLLPISTSMGSQKTRTRLEGRIPPLGGIFSCLSWLPYEGYEIHMGDSQCLFAAEKNVLGTYIHGIFDKEEIRQALLSMLMVRKGLEPQSLSLQSMADYKEGQYDLLADCIRSHLDMAKIYEIMGR